MSTKYIIPKEKLEKYLKLEITDIELFEDIPDDTNIAADVGPECSIYLTKYDVRFLLESFINQKISFDQVVDFAETMVLTDLFDWNVNNPDDEHEVVFNVLHTLESMGDEGQELSEIELREMLKDISEICK